MKQILKQTIFYLQNVQVIVCLSAGLQGTIRKNKLGTNSTLQKPRIRRHFLGTWEGIVLGTKNSMYEDLEGGTPAEIKMESSVKWGWRARQGLHCTGPYAMFGIMCEANGGPLMALRTGVNVSLLRFLK